jgi:hypothetical protein
VGKEVVITISVDATINLSATGSRKAPNAEVMFNNLAIYPSRRSVNDEKINT